MSKTELPADLVPMRDEFARATDSYLKRSRKRHATKKIAALAATAVLAITGTALATGVISGSPLSNTFSGLLGGSSGGAPGHQLPSWLKTGMNNPATSPGGTQRVIAENEGIRVFVERDPAEDGQPVHFIFSIGDYIGRGGPATEWLNAFAHHYVDPIGMTTNQVLQPPQLGHDRNALFGAAAANVAKVVLTYGGGGSVSTTGVDGGFLLLPDAHRKLDQLIAYDSSGHELERRALAATSCTRFDDGVGSPCASSSSRTGSNADRDVTTVPITSSNY
jgi:hypothetical protein